jgi:hypothetical protein
MSDDTPGTVATREDLAALDARISERITGLSTRVESEASGAADGVSELRDLVAALDARVKRIELGCASAGETRLLRADLTETTHDLVAISELLGHQLGEPFRARASEIATKRQTTQGG